MKTSLQWWNEVEADEAKFNEWLVKQYRGEVTAASRILKVLNEFKPGTQAHYTLTTIAEQEGQHAIWVKGLLNARGVEVETDHAEERYWSVVQGGAVDFEHACAVAAHAEAMRLERIRAIQSDQEAPADVRDVFQRILRDEVFHEAAFRNLAGELAMSETKEDHDAGRRLLGLVA